MYASSLQVQNIVHSNKNESCSSATRQEHLVCFGIPRRKLNTLQQPPKRIRDSQSWPVPKKKKKQNSETTFKDADGGRDKGACQDAKTWPWFSIFLFPDRQKSLSLIERPACFERRHLWSSDISAGIRVSLLVQRRITPPEAAFQVRRQQKQK